jgi:hypothetical protein
MATQTVYFNNPADITSLQTTTTSMSGSVASLNYGNNWTRGQFVSSDLIYTIPANCWTGPLPTLQGPAQAVDVYKVVYYSSDSTTSSVQRVSASVFVPAAISKTGSIVLNIKGLNPGNNSTAVGWETYSNPLLQAALTAASLNLGPYSTGPKPNPASPVDATYGIIFPSTYAIEAGLGYITCDADGFGLGVSQNDCVFNYMSQVNPQVDLLRCLRNMYTSGITSQKALFDNAIYDGSSFPVTVSGYSLGGIYAPGIANEFSANVSATIPATEASSFNFKRILCGAVPDGQNLISLLSNTNIGNFTVNPVLLFLFSNIGGNQPTHSLFAQPEALSTYWSFWTDIDQKANFSQDVANLAQLLGYSLEVAPPTSTYVYTPAIPGGQYGFSGADIRQLYRPEYTGSLGRVLKNLHGWTNPNRPLYTLPTGTSVAHIYSTLDEVVCPYGYTGGAPCLYGGSKTQQVGYNFDSAATLDRYMNAGDVGFYYNFTGASRPVTFSEIAVDPTLGFSSTGAVATSIFNSTVSIASATTLKNNTYARIPVNFNDSYTFLNTFAPGQVPDLEAVANHGGFFLYYQTVINSSLNSFTNAN